MVSAFEAVGQHSAGKIDDRELLEVERRACPGKGSCGGMFTANTMSSVFEAMGMSLPYSSTMAAEDDEKADSAARSARRAGRGDAPPHPSPPDPDPQGLRERHRRHHGASAAPPTRCCTCWRSPGRPEFHSQLDDFETIRARVPVLCDLKPSGRFVATDLHRAGGVPQVMKMLLDHGVLHGDALTISGETVAEVLREVPAEPRRDQEVIRPWERPLYAQGHLAILRGNLAPEGAVAKITGVKTPTMTGPGPRLRLGGELPRGDPRGRDPGRAT